MTVIPVVFGALGTVNKGLGNWLEDLRTSGDNPNYCIAEISQKTVKSSGELRRLVVTQITVKKTVN